MGKITELNKQLESMNKAGMNPLTVAKAKMKEMKVSDEDFEKLVEMMKGMDMDEEMDMEEMMKEMKACESYDDLKATIEKYMKK